MAVILNQTDDDIVRVHFNTYRTAKEEIPGNMYELMVDTTHEFKKTALNNPAKFFEYTSFFRIKPAYTWVCYMAYRAGVPLSKAPIVPSVLSFILIAFILVFLLSGSFDVWVAALLSLSIMVSPPMLEAAREAVPDTFSAFVILIYFSLVFQSRYSWISILILSLSILIRLDNIIFAIVAIGYLFTFTSYFGKTRLSAIILCITALAWIAYTVWLIDFFEIKVAYEFYGGLGKMINPLNRLKEMVVGLNTVQTSHFGILVMACGVALFYGRKLKFQSMSLNQHLFLMLMVYSIVRYVLFPNLTTRFFLPVYLMSFVILFIELKTLITSSKKIEDSEVGMKAP
jgi:hypothetical protein